MEIRVTVGLLLVVAFCLESAAQGLLPLAGRSIPAPGQDQISRFEQASNEAREKLPPYGVVGFASDRRKPSAAYATWDYYMAQYTLAPRVVVTSADSPQAIGNYRDGVRLAGGAER